MISFCSGSPGPRWPVFHRLIASSSGGLKMNPWICALYISIAGGAGGWVNAHMNNRGFIKPRCIEGEWCPGAIPTVLIGAFAAWASWAFYGSGIGIDLAD